MFVFAVVYLALVPEAYFSPVEPSGKRHDYASRPELSRGSVDIIASNPEYNTRTPARPSFVFALDVSETAVTSGLLQTCINALRSLLVELAEVLSSLLILPC